MSSRQTCGGTPSSSIESLYCSVDRLACATLDHGSRTSGVVPNGTGEAASTRSLVAALLQKMMNLSGKYFLTRMSSASTPVAAVTAISTSDVLWWSGSPLGCATSASCIAASAASMAASRWM